MKSIALILLLVSTSAFAHFKIGTYLGVDNNGSTCSIEFKRKTFTNNIKNPLNEQVYVVVNGASSFTLTHLPIIDNKKMTISADKSNLTAVVGGISDAISFQVHMDHNIGGPSSFTLLKDDWTNKTGKKRECFNLEFQEQ
jgi:hypothetical protein